MRTLLKLRSFPLLITCTSHPFAPAQSWAASLAHGCRRCVSSSGFCKSAVVQRLAVAMAGKEAADEAGEKEDWLSEWVVYKDFEEIDSTQSYVEREHEKFDQNKLTVVSADFQTAGRGTKDRQWHCVRAQSVLSTFYFRFPSECSTPFVNQNAPSVTKVLAISAVDVLRSIEPGLAYGVKWPNDIVVNGRKMGGILARACIFNGRLEGIIIGIGLNINTSQADLDLIERPVWPATSLRAESCGDSVESTASIADAVYDVARIRRQLADQFARNLRSFFHGGFASIRTRVNELEVLMGTSVRFRVSEESVIVGTFQGVDDLGHIMLLHNDGTVKTYPAGEIIPNAADQD